MGERRGGERRGRGGGEGARGGWGWGWERGLLGSM